jgi:hypothetical protein
MGQRLKKKSFNTGHRVAAGCHPHVGESPWRAPILIPIIWLILIPIMWFIGLIFMNPHHHIPLHFVVKHTSLTLHQKNHVNLQTNYSHSH